MSRCVLEMEATLKIEIETHKQASDPQRKGTEFKNPSEVDPKGPWRGRPLLQERPTFHKGKVNPPGTVIPEGVSFQNPSINFSDPQEKEWASWEALSRVQN